MVSKHINLKELVLESFARIEKRAGRIDVHMREVVSGAAIALILRLIGAIAQFGFNILVARMLGAEGLGIYALAFTASSFASLIGRVGLDQAMMRFIAINADRQEWGKLKDVFLNGMGIAFIASFITALILFLIAPWFSVAIFHNPNLARPMQWMSLSVIPFSLLNLIAESLRGLKVIHYSSLVQVVLVPVISGILMVALVSSGFGINGVVLAYASSTVVALIIGTWFWRRAVPQIWQNGIEGKSPIGDLMAVSVPLLWMTLMNMALIQADTFILGMFRSSSDVGVYSAASRMAMITGYVIFAVNSISAPKFAVLYGAGDMTSMKRLVKNSTRLMLFCAVPILSVFIFATNQIMGIYGKEFIRGVVPLMILSVGQFFFVAMGLSAQLLIMTGKQLAMRNVMIVSAASNIILCLILIPRLGMVGAALANGISYVFTAIAANYLVNRYLNIIVHPF